MQHWFHLVRSCSLPPESPLLWHLKMCWCGTEEQGLEGFSGITFTVALDLRGLFQSQTCTAFPTRTKLSSCCCLALPETFTKAFNQFFGRCCPPARRLPWINGFDPRVPLISCNHSLTAYTVTFHHITCSFFLLASTFVFYFILYTLMLFATLDAFLFPW